MKRTPEEGWGGDNWMCVEVDVAVMMGSVKATETDFRRSFLSNKLARTRSYSSGSSPSSNSS